jgi:hypothetical protein
MFVTSVNFLLPSFVELTTSILDVHNEVGIQSVTAGTVKHTPGCCGSAKILSSHWSGGVKCFISFVTF